ncbi:unnamed protein product [Urochloa humidicola]
MVQAWPMPFRVPASGVLGPRPGLQPQQAFAAQQYGVAAQPPSNFGAPPLPSSTPQPWDQGALLAALNNIAANPTGSSSDWYLDTGASTHMSSNPGSSYQGGDSAL